MNSSRIFIPNKIKVGFQNRKDTYTGKLAYIIYYDEKGVLRKEKSWNGWRDESIDSNEFENEPTSGFVLNKKVGGYKSHWNVRQTYIRVYDLRGFEFEITPSNLLYILENTNSIVGKGLEGEFVYGWDGTELVLIPTCAPDYKEIVNKSELINNDEFVKPSDLKIGYVYEDRKGYRFLYMGKSVEYKYIRTYDEPTEEGWSLDCTCSKNVWRKYIENGKSHWFFSVDSDNEITYLYKQKSVSKKFISGIEECYEGDYQYALTKLHKDPYYIPVDVGMDKIETINFEDIPEKGYVDSHFVLLDKNVLGRYYYIKNEEGLWISNDYFSYRDRNRPHVDFYTVDRYNTIKNKFCVVNRYNVDNILCNRFKDYGSYSIYC